MHALGRKQFLWLALLLTVWALFGLVGRDAWKPDEARVLGGLLDWRDHAWLFQSASAPLFSLVADLTASLPGSGLDYQDGARLASGLFALIAFLCTGLAARALFGPGHEAAAVLSLMGCLGLMLRAHALLPETAMLMAYALLLLGLVEARESYLRGGALLSAAFICLALARGWIDVAAGLLIVLATLLSGEWRTRAMAPALALALVVALSTVLGLDQALGAPGRSWLDMSLGFITTPRQPGTLLTDLAWVAWPVWPLALWAIWHDHRRLDREFTLYPMLAAIVVLFFFAHFSAYSREGGLVGLLVPLSLLSAKGMASLKRGAAQAMYWFGVLTFIFFGLVFWLYYTAIDWGWPVKAAARMAKLTPNYVPGDVGVPALALAGAATVLWLIAIPLFPRAKVRPVLVWATGMTFAWVLMFTLFRGWADAGWGYAPMIRDMATRLPAQACLRARVGDDVAAMLRYHLPGAYRDKGACDYWLIAGDAEDMTLDGKPMRLLWSGARPRYKRDIHSLYGVVHD
jgi:hypothetical protein